MANLPRIITEARAKIVDLVYSSFFRRGRSKGYKAMRCDFAEKFIPVIDTMLLGCCLEADGGLCRVVDGTARPLTVAEISEFSGVEQRTVERILAVLKDLGLLNSEKQFKRLFPEGLKVAAVWRVFTKLFWEKLGLWNLFVESVKYAAEHAHLKLKRPIKTVGKYIGNIFKRCLKLTDDQKKEQERQSAKNNQMFQDMCSCQNLKCAKTCRGGKKPEEICALCHRLHQ